MNRILLMVLRNITRVPGAYIKLCHYAKHSEKYSEKEKYDHIRYILKMGVDSGNIDFQILGAENIPKENGFLIYGNHQGLFDVVALVAAMPVPIAAVYKKEIENLPFIKQIATCTKSFAMDRSDNRQSLEVIQKVTKEVVSGRNYLIFPEGTRSRNGNEMLEFHGGSFRCAIKAKCPILPIALIDSYKVLDQKNSKPVSVQLHFLEPIAYDDYKDLKAAELAELVRSKIETVVRENA